MSSRSEHRERSGLSAPVRKVRLVRDTGRLVNTSSSAAAIAALRGLLSEIRGNDSLCPVDVVVPGAVGGVTVRRAVAGDDGLANVRFSSFPQLTELLAARQLALGADEVRLPLTASARTLALRATIADETCRSGRLATAAQNRATFGLLDELLAELDSVQIDPGATRDGLSALGREVLDVYQAYRERTRELVSPTDMLGVVADALECGASSDRHVVLYAPERLTAPERALLATVHERDRLSVVLLDDHTSETSGWLRELFGVDTSTSDAIGADVHITVTADAEDEVRNAVRTVLRFLAEHPVRPERVGIAYRAPVPYARLLAEQLTAAELPHHVPSRRTLAQTVAGRTLLGLFDLYHKRFPRAALIDWLSDGPILDHHERRVPAARWDRISREAGISRGVRSWREQLRRHAADLEAPHGGPADEHQAHRSGQAADATALAEFVEQVSAAAETALAAKEWTSAADAVTGVLRRFLGPRRRINAWNRTAGTSPVAEIKLEQDAYDAVVGIVAKLAELDGVSAPPTPGRIVDAVHDGLDQPVPSGTTLGRGILVGNADEFAGADLDLLLVVGMTEGAFPAPQREHPVLRDADRRALSPELGTVASRREQGRTRWLRLLRAAPRIELSYPRADSRSQRRQFAAPWLLEQASELAGRPVSAADLDTCTGPELVAAPWLTSYASFEDSLHRADAFVSGHELGIAVAMSGHIGSLAARDPLLRRGLAAARARACGDFGQWSGQVEQLPAGLAEHVDATLSATTLQQWATCPSSYFFQRVLQVRPLEDRANQDTIDARDKGTLMHTVLESLLSGHLGTRETPGLAPDTPWSPTDLRQATQLLDDHAADLQAQGLTGRDVVWAAQLAHLRRALNRALTVDSAMRRRRRSWPIAVEARFGRNGAPGLTVPLATQGAVTFAGTVDRVDVTENGELVVLDYKTGKGAAYKQIPRPGKAEPDHDLTDRGRKLQLVLYALAARQLYDMPDAPTDAYYWFVERGEELRGSAIDEPQAQRLRDVLDVVVGGIRNGVYPANPGVEEWRTGRLGWSACTYCPFDRVCPSTRSEQWLLVAQDPAVVEYAELAAPSGQAP